MTLGDKFMWVLFVEYVVLAGVFLFEGTWWKALYWVSAAAITVAVLNLK